MKIKTEVYTQKGLKKEIQGFLKQTVKKGNHRVCKTCEGPILTGFINVFPVDKKGDVLDTTPQPTRVPYCENCDPPDGFNHTYATRVFVRT